METSNAWVTGCGQQSVTGPKKATPVQLRAWIERSGNTKPWHGVSSHNFLSHFFFFPQLVASPRVLSVCRVARFTHTPLLGLGWPPASVDGGGNTKHTALFLSPLLVSIVLLVAERSATQYLRIYTRPLLLLFLLIFLLHLLPWLPTRSTYDETALTSRPKHSVYQFPIYAESEKVERWSERARQYRWNELWKIIRCKNMQTFYFAVWVHHFLRGDCSVLCVCDAYSVEEIPYYAYIHELF